MGRIIKWLFVLVILCFAVVVAYALVGSFPPPTHELTIPVTIDVD